MRKERLLPAVAVAGGAVGFGLRRWELATAFEPDTGLAIPGMPATWALILLSVGIALALLLLCRYREGEWSGGYAQAFSAQGDTVHLTAMVLCAFALLAAAGLMVLLYVRGENAQITRLLLAALCAASFACVLLNGRNCYRGGGREKYDFTLLMPAYTCCLWLISAYQTRAGDPVQLDYIYEILAIIAVLLGLYFQAGFSFERGRPGRTVFFSLMGVYCSIVTLADGHDLASVLLYCFAILYLLTSTVTLLRSAARPLGPRMPGAAAGQEDLNTEGSSDE